ncbi:chromosome partitioning protein ParA [Sphingorhabdus sp. IMCC26285]|jgi:ATP-binding protein involved in chromosome partitioning|uniref:Iron-sulfur cluster carrier protein n=1 Tax=Sphingorhabdus profundilacus TaxID=2509718 RepID=A0A6I4M1M4_9SPHN|nr:Mrp/NBP35 family ATP-binding protein [Sphingorhabdus profundilacus]MVZ96235.1 chromosome partitioning protein ParA [Sphingorhabdus profundilacus]
MTDFESFSRLVFAIAGPRAAGLKVDAGAVSLMLDVSEMTTDEREQIESRLRDECEQAGAQSVRIMLTAERVAPRLIAVASGKGGVGKSTLSTNLAVAMAMAGRSVGLVDADIYGPSQPRLMGAEDSKPEADGKKLIPVKGAGGVPFLSMGQLAKPGQAIAWRGPMAGNALSQLVDAHWGKVRDIIVDMPPGTGDIQLSMIQKHKPIGAVIISTPQDLALMDATRAIAFFDTAKVPIIGLVENMAGYLCPHCGEMSDPFGSGGAEAAAAELGISFLGRIPLDIDIRLASDAGTPPALGDSPIARAYAEIARQVGHWIDNPKAPAA